MCGAKHNLQTGGCEINKKKEKKRKKGIFYPKFFCPEIFI